MIAAIFGLPSALSYSFFQNQDWVWGLGLILSGSFFTFAVWYYGIKKFRKEFVDIVPANMQAGPGSNYF